MITLTRLDGSRLTVNAELIEFVEPTPDTVVTLVSGRRVIVREQVADIVRQVVEYRQRIYADLANPRHRDEGCGERSDG